MSYKVLIDLGKLKNLYSGLGQVSLNYGKTLANMQEKDMEWTFLVPPSFISQFGNKVNYVPLSFGRRHFPALYKGYDIWHAIHHDSAYFPADTKKTKYILTIHDFNFMEEKSQEKARKRLDTMQKKVNKASALTFISEFTKAEAIKHLKLPDVPMQVIYNGVEVPEKISTQRPAFLPEGEFLFTIGVIREKKNFHVLVYLMEQLPGLNIIIAGDKAGWYAESIEKAIQQNNLQNRIVLPGKISKEEKDYLYRNCKAFVFPSKLEGFGLPVIEAMHYGKPVFLSTFSSLPEIGGEHAFYWNNFSPTEMAEVFYKGMKATENNISFSEKLKAYARKFSWEENAKKYIGLYRTIAEK
jgi:glycosyltransferase involved in cell wall biosynthesis